MVHPSFIEKRLADLGFKHSRWFRAEIRELEHVLIEGEKIVALACGRYFGSFALLVATDQRLLLIDKRVFFMTIEDTRYDMISEIDFNSQLYYANVTIHTLNKTHKFTSMKYKRQLRDLTNYVQRRVFELRNQPSPAQDMLQSQTPQAQQYQPPAPAVYYSAPAQPHFTTTNDSIHHSLPAVPEPVDYYPSQPHQTTTADHISSSDHHYLREKMGHVAHLVGTAATRAAHHHTPAVRPRRAHPYIQGSLMTHRPISSIRPEPYKSF